MTFINVSRHINNMMNNSNVGVPPRPPLRGVSPYPASPAAWRPTPTQPPPPYSPAQPPARRPPEANSLVVNILLGDTALNIFRDHNFDSCTLCVCNAGPKVFGFKIFLLTAYNIIFNFKSFEG